MLLLDVARIFINGTIIINHSSTIHRGTIWLVLCLYSGNAGTDWTVNKNLSVSGTRSFSSGTLYSPWLYICIVPCSVWRIVQKIGSYHFSAQKFLHFLRRILSPNLKKLILKFPLSGIVLENFLDHWRKYDNTKSNSSVAFWKEFLIRFELDR